MVETVEGPCPAQGESLAVGLNASTIRRTAAGGKAVSSSPLPKALSLGDQESAWRLQKQANSAVR